MVNTKEIWKDIPGYEGMYQASTLGQIRGLDRYITCYRTGRTPYRIRQKGTILKPHGCGPMRNYLQVSLRGKHLKIYHLVLLAFIGPCPKGMEACHNNGDFGNNDLTNLRWDTHKSNCNDRIRHGKDNKGVKHGLSKLTDDVVRLIRIRLAAGESQYSIAKAVGINQSGISEIKRGIRWGHVK